VAQQITKHSLILIGCGMKRAPRMLAGVETDRRLEAMITPIGGTCPALPTDRVQVDMTYHYRILSGLKMGGTGPVRFL